MIPLRQPSERAQTGVALGAAPFMLAMFALASCAHFRSWKRCDEVVARDWPRRLSETGLYQNSNTHTLSAAVFSYRPRFELWSDGAQKRRWVYLPPDRQIDSSDMDAWHFPQGTKFWKEFVRDGVRVETRLLEKTGPGARDWRAISYVWSADGSDAIATPTGVQDARGTPHDVPAASACMGCHGGTRSRILGFSAIQLAPSTTDHDVDLDRLSREQRLTSPPAFPPTIPGDTRTQRVLGYLHANCGHCHNQRRPATLGHRCFDPEQDFDLSLRTDMLATVFETPVYQTVVGELVLPGQPEDSPLLVRLRRHTIFRPRMPPLATQEVDGVAVAMIRDWIDALRPSQTGTGSSASAPLDTP